MLDPCKFWDVVGMNQLASETVLAMVPCGNCLGLAARGGPKHPVLSSGTCLAQGQLPEATFWGDCSTIDACLGQGIVLGPKWMGTF